VTVSRKQERRPKAGVLLLPECQRPIIVTESIKIFYVADAGKSIEELATSVFVEKLDARGYEVLLLNQPVDEMLVQSLKQWRLVEVGVTCSMTLLT